MLQELPNLPYDYNALEPVISEEIMRLHHQKHHLAYVTNLNKALEQYQAAEVAQDVASQIALQAQIRFNGGGHINHSIFWTNLAPKGQGGGGEPTGDLLQALHEEFGSFASFKERMSLAALNVQGSGWAWLVYHPVRKKLDIVTCANQDPVSILGLVPLLGIDVWEHAYYLQYKNVRAEYVKGIFEVINWSNVQERFQKAR
ncbi:MAG: sod2 [Chlamydiales bacterium]|nr:sod2 [Chlamydiales bacterium]